MILNFLKDIKFLPETIKYLFLIFFKLDYYSDLNSRKKDFKKYTEENSITEKYSKLVSGLDSKSKFVVDNIIFRINKNKKTLFISNNNLSKKELEFSFEEYGLKARSFVYKDQDNSKYKYENIYPGLIHYDLSTFMFHHGLLLFENRIKDYFLDKDCIDGGAFLFDSAVIFGSHYPFKKIHSFEISKINLDTGKKILGDNYQFLKNITYNHKGLYYETTKLYIEGSSSITKISNKHNEDSIKVDFISLDEYSKENTLNIGYIKLDIEGAEYDAILGAKQTISKSLPVMSISIYHNFKDFFEIKPLIESMAPNKYDFFIRKLAYAYTPQETYLLCVPKSLNLKPIEISEYEILG